MNYMQRSSHAAALFRLGVLEGHPLHLNFGNRNRGLDLMRNGLAEAASLLRLDRENEDLAASIALYRRMLAGAMADQDEAAARDLYRQAAKFYDEAMPKTPMHRRYRVEAARVQAEMADLLRRIGKLNEAAAALDKAELLENEISERHAFTSLVKGNLAAGHGHGEQARSAFEDAVNLAGDAVKQRPSDMELRREQADCMERLGEFYRVGGNPRAARDWYAKALAVWSDWANYGVSSVYDQGRRRRAAALLAKR